LLLAAANAAAIPSAARGWLLSLAHLPGTPTAGLILGAWAVLSLPSGLAAWLAWRRPGHRQALLLWGWHLLACAIWTESLLALRLPVVALAAVLALLTLGGATAAAFARLRPAAGLLLLPTLAWTCFALYTTAGLWWLNRG
jgi:tryptophan-rich sensory protein